jgi:hypothetical protein
VHVHRLGEDDLRLLAVDLLEGTEAGVTLEDRAQFGFVARSKAGTGEVVGDDVVGLEGFPAAVVARLDQVDGGEGGLDPAVDQRARHGDEPAFARTIQLADVIAQFRGTARLPVLVHLVELVDVDGTHVLRQLAP